MPIARNLIPSAKSIRTIKPGDPRQRVNDGDGLHLLLNVKGGAHGWRFAYRFEGRRNILSLGTYPDTGLADARQKADQARKLLSQDVDPGEARKSAKGAAKDAQEAQRLVDAGLPPADSFEAVAREWLSDEHGVKVSEGHVERKRIRLVQDIWIGHTPIGNMTRSEFLACLRRVQARGALETAHRIKCPPQCAGGVSESLAAQAAQEVSQLISLSRAHGSRRQPRLHPSSHARRR